MTVIAAVAREGRVVMAADDAATLDDADRFWPNPPKIARVNAGDLQVLIGWSGASELLPYFLRHWDVAPPGADLHDWAQDLAEGLTAAAAEMVPSCLTSPAGQERAALDGHALLGHAGRLWTLDANCAGPVPDGVAVIGSGGHVAFGVLHGALANSSPPCDAVRLAVAVACRFTTSCQVLDAAMQVEELDHP